MAKFNLSDAAKSVLLGEDSKSTFDANIKSKMGQRGGEKAPHGEVGADKLPEPPLPLPKSWGVAPETASQR